MQALNSRVINQYVDQGVQVSGSSEFYTRDHLGSIRESTDSMGTTVLARYDYDPYGRRAKLAGSMDADFGFTGHYYDAPSGLRLPPYRAYSASLGRWISRDPIGEAGGLNLYESAYNAPTLFDDPLGLLPGDWYTNLAEWTRYGVDVDQSFLDSHFPWQVAGTGDTILSIFGGLLGTPEAVSHLGEGSGCFSANPGWETSPGLFWDISLTADILAGGLAQTEIGNASIGWKGGEVTFTRPGANTPDLRINPTGGSGYPPHYHRRPGIGKHRPWQGGF